MPLGIKCVAHFFLTSLLSCPWAHRRMLRMWFKVGVFMQLKKKKCFLIRNRKLWKFWHFLKVCQNLCECNCLFCKLVYLSVCYFVLLSFDGRLWYFCLNSQEKIVKAVAFSIAVPAFLWFLFFTFHRVLSFVTLQFCKTFAHISWSRLDDSQICSTFNKVAKTFVPSFVCLSVSLSVS